MTKELPSSEYCYGPVCELLLTPDCRYCSSIRLERLCSCIEKDLLCKRARRLIVWLHHKKACCSPNWVGHPTRLKQAPLPTSVKQSRLQKATQPSNAVWKRRSVMDRFYDIQRFWLDILKPRLALMFKTDNPAYTDRAVPTDKVTLDNQPDLEQVSRSFLEMCHHYATRICRSTTKHQACMSDDMYELVKDVVVFVRYHGYTRVITHDYLIQRFDSVLQKVGFVHTDSTRSGVNLDKLAFAGPEGFGCCRCNKAS